MAIQQDANFEKLVDHILDQIMQGKLRKGERLPTERQMAESMNISRSSVREALKALEAMGIANSIQGSGTYITDQPEDSINKSLCALFALTDGTLDNILQLRILLESQAFRDIVHFSSDREIRALTELADYDYNLPISDQSALDARFHHALVSHSQNTMAKYLYNTLSSLMDIYRDRVLTATFRKGENDLTREGHLVICAALARRDAEAAAEALREHLDLNDIYRYSLELFPDDSMPSS